MAQIAVLEGMDDLGEPPEFLVRGVATLAGDPGFRQYMNDSGKALAGTAFSKLPLGPKKPGPPTPQNPWIAQVVNPIMGPLTAGFEEEFKVRLRPLAIKAGIAVLAVGALGFFLGRYTRRS
jgi:hypothetical protein